MNYFSRETEEFRELVSEIERTRIMVDENAIANVAALLLLARNVRLYSAINPNE